MKVIKVGSRESKLAVIQAQMVIDAIKEYDSSIEVELITMKTTGDKILDKTLDKIGGKGLFVKELDEALLKGEVDITVHSYKDMPMEIPKELPIVALSQREDVRDVWIAPQTPASKDLPVGCSSKRRSVQLNKMGYTNIQSLRGNVITRLQKLDDHKYSSIILAAAGLIRLGLHNRISRFFSTQEIIPSASQGIIAVQARQGENTDYLKLFDCEQSHIVSKAERAFVKELNGGCTMPVAAYACIEQSGIVLNGLYADEEQDIYIKGTSIGNVCDAEQMGINLAKKLIEDAKK